MKHIKSLVILLLTLGNALWVQGQADSVDVLDYDVSLDLSAGKPFAGDATLTLRMLQPCQSIGLSLRGTADSIWVDGTAVTADLGSIPTGGYAAGDTLSVRVCYHGSGYVEPYGFGGFHFDNDISYNLGAAFMIDPHVIGAAFVPCRDNFQDKATYTLRIHTRTGWTAECSGQLVSRTVEADGTERSVWRIAQPVSTYLVGISQAAWHRIQGSVNSLHGNYPLTLGYTTQDSASVAQAFAGLDLVVPMFEQCLGPYRWNRIGYIATHKGSMEHVNNIALADVLMDNTAEQSQMTIAHELGHAWFGNLVTCAAEGDMWINEGGASFTSEVAMEAALGREASDDYYQRWLESVLRTTHINDGGYRALSPMPHDYTYGSTTYDKGALVWHSLRGYLGDSLFYSALQRLMSDKAFGNVHATEVRDSLSAYTGVDLTDFFQFHVFSPGFVDYRIDLQEANCVSDVVSLRLRQQTVGGTDTVHSTRLPVTFFSSNGQQSKFWIESEEASTLHTIRLPFVPAYYVIDYDMEISDAATLAVFKRHQAYSNELVHFRYSGDLPADAPMVVEHHWGRPWDLEGVEGIIRPANRYWMVRGPVEQYDGVQGLFHYLREGGSTNDYAHLDRGFISKIASVDSVVMFYRSHVNDVWQAISHRHTGTHEGYFVVDNLRPGEYALAVADTNLLSIADPSAFDGQRMSMVLFPNPVAQGEALTLEVPTDESFTVRIVDTAGRRVWQRRGCRNGQSISPRLASGTYMVEIENKNVSLQSKLIVL